MARRSQSEHLRNKLLDQGVVMFMEQGYHGTGIQEVVDKVGIPKGSFYNYFKSKEDFGSKAIIHYSDQFKEFLISILEVSKKDTLKSLNQFFDQLTKLFDDKNCRDGCLIGNFAAEISDSSIVGRETMQKCISEWKDIFKKIMIRGQEKKVVRDDISADELADFLLNFLEGSLIRMKIESDTNPLKQMKRTFLNYALIN
ncbi:MAG: TetR family transcriptional regulator [Thermodesulfobacteriota bacterium]|nr:MAG: TetR family transcriptional regulator [Thermodesulfobacteriota bacterium]